MTPPNSYKFVFYPKDPTLCFIGAARPFIGGIPSLAEIAVRWAAHVYSGKVPLPDADAMMKAVQLDTERHRRLFPEDHVSRPTLVNQWEYSDEITSYFGAKPRKWWWLFHSPVRWFKIVSSPWTGHLYMVEDSKTREKAFEHIDSTFDDNHDHFPFNGFNVVMLIMDFVLVGILLVLLVAVLYVLLLW